MNTIYKYPLQVTDEQDVALPEHATILTVQVQNGQLCLWAAVDTDLPATPRTLVMLGTGYVVPLVPDGMFLNYIGTVQTYGGALVWHIFEKRASLFYPMLQAGGGYGDNLPDQEESPDPGGVSPSDDPVAEPLSG